LLSGFIAPSFFSLLLFIRKKFLSFCGNGLWPLVCLLDDIEKPEKFRFSLGVVLPGDGDEPWNKAVMIREFGSSFGGSHSLWFDIGGGDEERLDVEKVGR
jgi:hypothetical protein